MGKREAWNTILVFCILTFGFTAATIIKPSDDFSETENRSLAQMPKLTGKNILDGTFESDYESYLTDQFILRDAWIGLKTDVERLAMKKESKDIYFADDDYLIEKHTGSFTTTQAERNIQSLAQFFDMYQDTFPKGHRSVLLIPNAVDILRDKLPPFAAPYDEEDYLAKAKATLADDLWVDAGSVLRQHTDTQLYYRTDHHWTTEAAFYVYQNWAAAQKLPVRDADHYEIRTVTDACFADPWQYTHSGVARRVDLPEAGKPGAGAHDAAESVLRRHFSFIGRISGRCVIQSVPVF